MTFGSLLTIKFMTSLNFKNFIQEEKLFLEGMKERMLQKNFTVYIRHKLLKNMVPNYWLLILKEKKMLFLELSVNYIILDDLSTVPYGESSAFMKGWHSPYFTKSHIEFRKEVRRILSTIVNFFFIIFF